MGYLNRATEGKQMKECKRKQWHAADVDGFIYLTFRTTLIHKCQEWIHAPFRNPYVSYTKHRLRYVCTETHNHRSAATISTQNTPLQNGRCISVSVIAQHTPHVSSTLPQDMPAKQTKSVTTLDLWFNRVWQHWKVVNEIAFFICMSVFANKST